MGTYICAKRTCAVFLFLYWSTIHEFPCVNDNKMTQLLEI